MKSTDFIIESIGEDADEMHRDHEVQMARSDCYHAAKYAIELHKMLHKVSEEQGLGGWVQEKITLACDYLRTVHEHLDHDFAMQQSEVLPAFTFEGAEAALQQNLSEINPHNYDSDEDYYNDLHGSGSGDSGDVDPDEDDFEPEDEPESHYEKHVRVHGLGEGEVVNFPSKKPKADDVGIVRRTPKTQPNITAPKGNITPLKQKSVMTGKTLHSIYEGEDEDLFGHSDKAELYTAVRGMRRGGEVSGTSANGFVRTTYEQLVNTFGEPMYGPSDESDDEKISCEWVITFGDKNRTVATIYDWKTYDGTPMHEYEWHVGGMHGSRATDFVEAALKFKQGSDGSQKNEGQQWPDTSNSLAKRKAVVPNLDAYHKGETGGTKAGRTNGMTVATRVDPSITSPKLSRPTPSIPNSLKKPVSEMTAGGTGAGGFATGPAGGGNFKKTTGVPKKVKNVVKPKNVQVGKGIY